MSRRRLAAAVAFGAVATLITLTAPGLANVNVSKSGWAWANPVPQGRTLRAIAFTGGVGYATGDGGTVLSTTNAGQSWSGLTTGTTANLEHVQVLSPSTVVVGGGGGCVTRISTDSGRIFKRIFNVAESGCPEPVAAFSFLSPEVGVLLLKDGSVEVTADGGETFSRKTGIPGTPASSGGGNLVGTDVHFFSPTSGTAFVSDPHSGVSSAYMTPDGGVSWTSVPLPAGAHVTSVHFVDSKNAYAIGPETLLRSTDGGEEWEPQASAKGNSFNSIDCSTPTTCILTVTGGNQLIETSERTAAVHSTERTEGTEGTEHTEHTEHGTELPGTERIGLTVKTVSSALLYGAGYASSTNIAAVGAGGATVLSGDGGATFKPASSDIGGQYNKLRLGPAGVVLAPGARGNLALSTDGGQAWQVIATQTSQELVDAAFGTSTLGYVLDARGGLQRTTNGGASWQTLNPGTSRPARAVVAIGANTAMLIGPVGIVRAVNGGPFESVGGKVAYKALVSDYDLAGSTVFAFGSGTHTLIRSTDEGAKWTAIRLPLARSASKKKGKKVRAYPGVAVRSVAFTSPQVGLILDTQGELWTTRNGGRSWTHVFSQGTGEGIQLAFSDPLDGYMSVRAFGGDANNAYVLRTTNGGVTWHPQEISAGSIPHDGLVASSSLNAAVLIDGPSGGEPLNRFLFTTSTGGDVAGTAEALSLRTPKRVLTEHKPSKRHPHRTQRFSVRVNGTLAGAVGGEQIVVSARGLNRGPWMHRTVVAGANGGSFSTTWELTASTVFVAQWSGDSGRPGQGSAVLTVIVRPPTKAHRHKKH
ncbi:MAG: WD40/YVTN/BNR-like repeat-containing protein [Solirubrobacteraceae bacterium]